MQNTGIPALDTTVQKTNVWLKEVMDEIGSSERRHAYLALRHVLHALRDRLTVQEATDLGAQLPMLLRGLYYEGWNPADKPLKFHRDEFFSSLREQFASAPVRAREAEKMAQAVFKVLDRHITSGEIEDIKAGLPQDLREFWESLQA